MAQPNDELRGPERHAPTTPPPAESKGLPKRLRNVQEAQDESPASAISRSRPERLQRALELATTCARIADENRARDVLLLDLQGVTPLVDFFVIATAGSRRQANSIASEIDAEMKKLDERKLGMEGSEEGRWLLIDYGDFIVHVFSEEAREYYSLESIWGDAPELDWTDPSRPRRDEAEPDEPSA